MGECYSKPQQQSLRSTSKSPQPQKCLVLENPPSLILQLSNGSIETIPIKPQFTGSNLSHRLSPGIFFGSQNQLYLIVEASQINDRRILDAVYGYQQTMKSKIEGVVEPDCAFLLRGEGKVVFAVRSVALSKEGKEGKESKFVDLVHLGCRMREKGIGWQDLEFTDIVQQVCRRYSRIYGKEQQISNVIIGSDGSVHMLTFSQPSTSPSKSTQNLQTLLLCSLYGIPVSQSPKQPWPQLQKSSQFPHPNSLSLIQSLPTLFLSPPSSSSLSSSLPPYTPISNPALKFLRDYITAYYYKFQYYSEELVDAMILLGQYQGARVLLEGFVGDAGVYERGVDQEGYGVIRRVLRVEEGIDGGSAGTATARARVCSAAQYLGNLYKSRNQYSKAHHYYTECLTHKTSPSTPLALTLPESLYLNLAQTCRALGHNIETQSTLLQGLVQYPQSRILNLLLVLHLCDCMRVQEAEQRLMRAMAGLRTLEVGVCSGKILLAKAVVDRGRAGEYLGKAKEELEKVILEQYQKYQPKTDSHPEPALPIYHETLADLHLQSHSFSTAQQHYHISKLLLLSSKASSYRLASITAAQANCLLMREMYREAVEMYEEAQGYLWGKGEQREEREEGVGEGECKGVRDGIRGNKGIARIRGGDVEQGVKDIEGVLMSTPKEVIANDYNYIFLQNFLTKFKSSQKSP